MESLLSFDSLLIPRREWEKIGWTKTKTRLRIGPILIYKKLLMVKFGE
jgi:hypothetical protein